MPEYAVAAAAAVVAVVALEVWVLGSGLFRRPAYWVAMAIVVAFQVLVDGWLTKLSAPIVLYDGDQVTGVRLPWDIPVEDFFFGFALVTLVLALWERARTDTPRGAERELGHGRRARRRMAPRLGPRGRRRTLSAAAPVCARISVIVPARDEAARLPRLLDSLAADAQPYEVLVVDDRSTDGTAAVARAAGATVVPAERPAGWSGKAYACWAGAQAAQGDLLVFLDADVEPAPGAVGAWRRPLRVAAAWCPPTRCTGSGDPTNCCRLAQASWPCSAPAPETGRCAGAGVGRWPSGPPWRYRTVPTGASVGTGSCGARSRTISPWPPPRTGPTFP